MPTVVLLGNCQWLLIKYGHEWNDTIQLLMVQNDDVIIEELDISDVSKLCNELKSDKNFYPVWSILDLRTNLYKEGGKE